METKYAIEIKDLHFAYNQDNTIFQGLSIGFRPNKFTVLLGVNGCGKSTLFKILAGLQRGFSGKINFFGTESSQLSTAEKAQMIGFLPQAFQSIFPFTVKEILQTGRAAFSRFSLNTKDHEIIYEIANKLEISDLLHTNFNELSGGQQQRILIGRILVQNPKIILLDEPTNHLDIHQQHELMAYLQTLTQKGYTILAIMHDPSLAIRYADDIFVLHHKKIIPLPEVSFEKEQLLKEVFSLQFTTINIENQKIVIPKLL